MIELINEFIQDAEKYTAHNGKTCYRTFGNLDYYFLMCAKFKTTPKTELSGLSYESSNEFIELDYCEHDIILHVKKIKEVDKWGSEYIYSIVDEIKKPYQIWNIGEHAPKNILPLVVCDKAYQINTNNMQAIITPNAKTILDAVGIVGDTIPKMKKYIKKNNNIFCERMKKAIKILKDIDKRG